MSLEEEIPLGTLGQYSWNISDKLATQIILKTGELFNPIMNPKY
ncbi:hypothetical protein [Desulfosporosinus orientis]|nr:hypothetical protein [Desulfosporosinus orientis]